MVEGFRDVYYMQIHMNWYGVHNSFCFIVCSMVKLCTVCRSSSTDWNRLNWLWVDALYGFCIIDDRVVDVSWKKKNYQPKTCSIDLFFVVVVVACICICCYCCFYLVVCSKVSDRILNDPSLSVFAVVVAVAVVLGRLEHLRSDWTASHVTCLLIRQLVSLSKNHIQNDYKFSSYIRHTLIIHSASEWSEQNPAL